MSMRSVSFVQRLELDVPGNLFTHALVLGDVDNDQQSEFVVGTVNGLLCIFKGMNAEPWKAASGLGMVTCVGIGDVCNKKKNVLVCLTAEGWCHLFHISDVKVPTASTEKRKGSIELDKHKAQSDKTSADKEKQKAASDAEKTSEAAEQGGIGDLQPNHTQHIPANTKMVLIYDVDNDGKCELIVGHTDRIVRAYRWVDATPAETDSSGFSSGHLEHIQQWYLPGQVGSLAVNTRPDGTPMLVVSQPGCNYVELVCVWATDKNKDIDQATEQHVIYHPISTTRARNPGVSTEILGHISRGEDVSGKSGLYALCTLDGTLMLVTDDKIVWSHLVDHQLFAIAKLDITGDGKEEVLACAWDGQTYIVDQKKQTVRFHFEQNVCAFCAGHYGVDGRNSPALVYATFNNQIYLYWNVKLNKIPSASLRDVLAADDTLQKHVQDLNVNSSDSEQLRQLYRWCLYGKSPQQRPEYIESQEND
ncbi:KICSTOR complex protein ITFG2-like [Ptychodera flava]|uniref:KICSTOR complex protein ITFG2-like n=1 Tax=Ptychodera flava TaxID=63121 RepID=UPI00396A025F